MSGCIDWLGIANIVCNTFSLVALAYIGTLVGLNRRDNGGS